MMGIMSLLGTGYAQELSENPYGVESTSNPYGQYGSPFGIESVNNPFGRGIPFETLLEMKESLDWIKAAEILPEENELLRRESLSLRTYAYVEDEADRHGFCRVSGCGHKSMIGEDYCYTHGA